MSYLAQKSFLLSPLISCHQCKMFILRVSNLFIHLVLRPCIDGFKNGSKTGLHLFPLFLFPFYLIFTMFFFSISTSSHFCWTGYQVLWEGRNAFQKQWDIYLLLAPLHTLTFLKLHAWEPEDWPVSVFSVC